MSAGSLHRPVLVSEVRDGLAVPDGSLVVDGTLGDGGHSEMFCEQVGSEGLVIGIDQDPEAVLLAAERLARFGDRFQAVHGNFKDLPRLITSITDRPVSRVLLDLGWSTTQFVTRGRGFSFMTNEELDMRFDPTRVTETARDIVNNAPLRELIRIFRLYGEEPRAEKIAQMIVDARERQPITTTQQLAHLVTTAAARTGPIHPATQVFQALRIAVNDELGVLREALESITAFIPSGARVGVITFHSLEDRIVKRFVADDRRVRPLNRQPIAPTPEEIQDNPRSRSSKLRIFEKI